MDKDCIQLSKFIEENLSETFEGDKVFYEFTREKEDIHGDTEVILMHKVGSKYGELLACMRIQCPLFFREGYVAIRSAGYKLEVPQCSR